MRDVGVSQRQIRAAAIRRLFPELQRKSVHVHLVILVVRPWPDRAFNNLTSSFHRFAFPDADAKCMIVRSRVDWQRNVGRKPAPIALASAASKPSGS